MEAGKAEEQDMPENNWMETKASFHELFDDQLKLRESTLYQFLDANDSTKFWKLWAETFENTLIQFCNLDFKEAKGYKGIGKTIRKGVTANGRWAERKVPRSTTPSEHKCSGDT